MAEFYYRETEGESRRATGPYESPDEARKAARYRGLLKVEVIKRQGAGYEVVDAPQPRAAANR